jgi:hypothetical protein
MLGWTINPLTKDAIRSSEFVSNDDLINSIKTNPEAVVLSSIPYSDPRISNILDDLSGFESTKAYKSLSLLWLNADRRNHIEIAWERIWNLWVISEPSQIFDFLKGWVSKLVVKAIDWSWGGNAVDVLLNEAQIQSFAENWQWEYIVNKFFDSQLLVSDEWSFTFHIRPFFSADWKYLWSALKISEKPANFNNQKAWRNWFKINKQWFNSSSGLSKTFIFDKNGNVIIWVASKNAEPLTQNQAIEYLAWFRLNQEQVLTPELITELALWAGGIIFEIQSKANSLLLLN